MGLTFFIASVMSTASSAADTHPRQTENAVGAPRAAMPASDNLLIGGATAFVGPLLLAVRPADQDSWWPKALRHDLTRSVYRHRDFTARHFETGTGSRRLIFDYSRNRVRFSRDDPDRSLAARRRAGWSATAAYSIMSHGGDTIRLAATVQGDRRKPYIAVEDGHWLASRTRMATLSWQMSGSLAVQAAWLDASSSRARAVRDRSVMLAAGSPIAEHGYGVSVALKPRADPRLRMGVNFGAMTVDPRDVLALGARTDHDLRATVSLGFRFR